MELKHEAARKTIHVALVVLPLGAWLASREAPLVVQVLLLLLAVAVFILDRLRRRPGIVKRSVQAAVGPLIRGAEENRILGSTLYFVALAASFILFPATWALAAMVFLVAGDAAAALVGRAFGRFQLRRGKTLEGSLACLLACLGVAFLLAALEPSARLAILIPGAVAASAGEFLADGDRDNLTMPLLSGAVMWLTARTF